MAGTVPLRMAAHSARNTSWCAKGRSFEALVLVWAMIQTAGQRVSCTKATSIWCMKRMVDIRSSEVARDRGEIPLMVVQVVLAARCGGI